MALTHEEFIALYTSAQPSIQRFVSSHIPDYHDVQDVMQTAAVTLWKKSDDFVPGTDFRRWAITVARFEVLHARRANAAGRLVLTPALSEKAEARYSQLEFSEIESERRALDGCMGKLSDAQRGLLKERYRTGHSCAAIARERGTNGNQIRAQLFRIRSALRKCINAALGTGSSPEEAHA